MKIAEQISDLIGNTPMLKLSKFSAGTEASIIAKLEYFNPMSSVKDRIALAMIEDAEKTGKLKKGTTIIEPTSGNTGIGLSFVAASKGYEIILTMPESMSVERRKLLKAFGAKLVLTPAEKGMKGAIDKALELSNENPNSFIPGQFINPANPEVHRKTTAEEIWEDTNGKIDYLVAGIGTGGTITGCAEVLKKKNPDLKVFAVEPEESDILSGGKPGPHKIQGIGAGFIPGVLNTSVYDEVIRVPSAICAKTALEIARSEGIFPGISSAAAAYAAKVIAARESSKGKNIVVIFPDSGERYLSILDL